MVDIVATTLVIGVLFAVLALQISRFLPQLRSLVWLAFLERLICAVAQIFFGADSRVYAAGGAALSSYMDRSFGTAAPEVLAMLFQRPSRFDALIASPESNTGSMVGASACLTFLVRSADYAVPFLVTGLAFFGSLAIFKSFQDAVPSANPRRLFAWTVLFPSIAFWTSALIKETFCLIGIGCVCAAWRYSRSGRWLLAAPFATVGIAIVLLFRAGRCRLSLLDLVRTLRSSG